MNDVFVRKPHSAELDSKFLPAVHAADTSADKPPSGVPMHGAPYGSESAYRHTVWIREIFSPVQSSTISAEIPLSAEIFLSGAQVGFLRQIRSDMAQHGATLLASPAAVLCARFVEGVGLILANIPSVRLAAFAEDEDEISLVVHSRPNRRQVTFEFLRDGATISIVRIDEVMSRSEESCSIDHARTLRDAIAWLTRHP